jgi:Holliday junction resolvasome RuvABC endonuclease subunit
VIIITIDPGFGGTGYCIATPRNILDMGVIHPKKKYATVYDRMLDICNQIENVTQGCGEAYIEFPEVWSDSAKSLASNRKGDLLILSALIGAISRTIADQNIPVKWLTPRQWKGQLTKEVVIKRIEKTVPELKGKLKNHAADAVGMALHLQEHHK